MNPDHPSPSRFAQRAFQHIQNLAAQPRGSATPAEQQAAEYAQAELRSIGVKDIRLEPFLGLRSLWLFLALALGLALVGHAAFWLLRAPAGDVPALVIAVACFGFSGFLLWRFFSFHDYPLRNSLPHGPSQNVVGVIPPAGEVQQRVVLVGHLDSHRAVFWFASDVLVYIFGITSLFTLYGVYLAIPIYILAVASGLKFFAWLGLALAAFHFLGWFTGVTADLGRYSPGANDNASGVGSVLALGERLQGEPLRNTEVWLALTGCEESGCGGMLSLIREHGSDLKQAWFIDLEMVGIGDGLQYTTAEGTLHRHHIPPQVEELMKEIGPSFDLHPVKAPLVGAFSEAGTLWEYGFKAVCFSAHYKGSPVLSEWHRLTDTPSHIQVDSLERAHTFVWALLHRIDQHGA